MTVILNESDATIDSISAQRIAVIGYGNQGRSWALNLRDSGLDVGVYARADSSRELAELDGFDTKDLSSAAEADVICVLIPDDVIPTLELSPSPDALVVVASGYTLAFGRLNPTCDVGMVAPRMLGPEVRQCYLEGVGFITALGVQRDETGTARERVLAVALAIGGLRQGAIEMTPTQEAILDLGVEQALAPALKKVSESFVQVMLEQGIPIEAIVTELVLSGEVERTYRLVRLEGGAAQMAYHSPTSQYGQMSRAEYFAHLDLLTPMRERIEEISSGKFADEWDAERDAGYPRLEALRAKTVSPEILAFEADLRSRLGERAVHN